MLKKYYWYKINSNGKDIGDGVTSVWFWQGAIVAHKNAINCVSNCVSNCVDYHSFSFSEFKRIK